MMLRVYRRCRKYQTRTCRGERVAYACYKYELHAKSLVEPEVPVQLLDPSMSNTCESARAADRPPVTPDPSMSDAPTVSDTAGITDGVIPAVRSPKKH